MPKAAKKPTQKALRAARALEHVPHPGLKFSHKHYVFITRAKSGELWALNQLSVEARSAVTPLLEVVAPAPPQKDKSGKLKPAKTVSQHAKDVLQVIKDEWSMLPVFIDTRYLRTGGVPSATAAKVVFDIARSLQLQAVPVTALTLSPEFQTQIRDIAGTDKRGVVIRLSPADFKQPDLLQRYLSALLQVLQAPAEQVDIVIDLQKQTEQFIAQQAGISTLGRLPFLDQWRTVTLAAGCFPESISRWRHDIWLPIERLDWLAWLEVISAQGNAGFRVPSYGDYGIRSGGEPLHIPNLPDPNIRYSTSDKVLVRKGAKEDGKIKEICTSLIQMPEFSTAAFSSGDKEIAARAARPGSPNNGQPTQWIQWCTNHHLELTASQIRKLP
jgi:hypothetical protein